MHLCTDLSFSFTFSLQRQYIRIREGFVLPILAFQQDGAGLFCVHPVPLPSRHIHSNDWSIGRQFYALSANGLW